MTAGQSQRRSRISGLAGHKSVVMTQLCVRVQEQPPSPRAVWLGSRNAFSAERGPAGRVSGHGSGVAPCGRPGWGQLAFHKTSPFEVAGPASASRFRDVGRRGEVTPEASRGCRVMAAVQVATGDRAPGTGACRGPAVRGPPGDGRPPSLASGAGQVPVRWR